MYNVSCEQCAAEAINGIPCHESGCTGHFTYTNQRTSKLFNKFTIWTYDVWGNKRDGFEVNDRSKQGTCMISVDGDSKEVIKALKNLELINLKTQYKTIDVEWTDLGHAELTISKSGEPFGCLEII